MNFKEGLSYAIKKQKFLIWGKTDDTSDEDAADENAEDAGTSNSAKADSDPEIKPDDLDTPFDVCGELNNNMEFIGLRLKGKKEILKLLFYAVRFYRE